MDPVDPLLPEDPVVPLDPLEEEDEEELVGATHCPPGTQPVGMQPGDAGLDGHAASVRAARGAVGVAPGEQRRCCMEHRCRSGR